MRLQVEIQTAIGIRAPGFPNGISDVATFGADGVTSVSLSAGSQASGLIFLPGASQYTISAATSGVTLTIGSGIINNSGIVQSFVAGVDGAGNFSSIV
jgi:hypothetical protein